MAGSVMAGQRDALIWLINQILAQGYELRPGHVLMTGSIGSMHPGKAGRYRADFGALGGLTGSRLRPLRAQSSLGARRTLTHVCRCGIS